MRIGIDCSELGGKPTGVGRFMRAILHGLAEMPVPHEFFLYHMGDAVMPAGQRFVPRAIGGSGRRLFREQFRLPSLLRQDAIEFFFTPGYWLPLFAKIPSVFSLHDIAFISHPEWFTRKERMKRTALSRLSARRARAVATISEFSRSEILRHYEIPADRVYVLTVGLDPELLENSSEPAIPRHGQGPLILSVGSLFQRRRTDTLLRACVQILDRYPDATLWIAGENRTTPHIDYGRMADELGISNHIIFTGYTDEWTIRELYRKATVMVYLSEYEGFGLPPLEASAYGVPVVTSRGSSLEEIFSNSARLVDPSSSEDVARAIADILSEERTRLSMRESGFKLAARHTPVAAAKAFLTFIEETASV